MPWEECGEERSDEGDSHDAQLEQEAVSQQHQTYSMDIISFRRQPTQRSSNEDLRFDRSSHGNYYAIGRETMRTRVSGMASSSGRQDPSSQPTKIRLSLPLPLLSGSEGSAGKETRGKIDDYLQPVLGDSGFIGRNSTFHDLSPAERENLVGLEYKAVGLLSIIVPAYFVVWQLLGAISVGAWINNYQSEIVTDDGLNPWWAGAFFAVSAFNNSGMALLDANAIPLQRKPYPLLTLGLLILAGNTCFPIFLRLTLWIIKCCIPKTEEWEKKKLLLNFILDHPRRLFTHLFPSTETWRLVLALIVLNGIDWVAFEVLSINNKRIEPGAYRALDGLFQALAIRTGGFSAANISHLRQGLLFLYFSTMYMSALPVAITLRATNVYENKHNFSFYSPSLPRRLRFQIAHDVWWIALATLFITITETGQFERNPVVFSIFNVMFEVMSAYGCVGISTGVPWNTYSFCGAWHSLSKLILCVTMLRGRHRGLPGTSILWDVME